MTKELAEELKKNGIISVESLAIRSLSELQEMFKSGYMLEHGEACNFQRAKKALEEAWRLTGFWIMKASEIEAVRGKRLCFSSGSKAVDDMLGGGIFSREITEFCGEFGCVAGDTLVAVGNGKLKPIRKIAEELIGQIKEGVYPVRLKVLSLRLSNGSLQGDARTRANATELHIYKCDKLLKIVTETGKEIKVTENHPLYVFRQGWREARKLRIGDKIKVFNKISCRYTKNPVGSDDFVTFCGILGFLVAEGWKDKRGEARIAVGNKNLKVIEKFAEMIESIFNIKPCILKRKGFYVCHVNSRVLYTLLKPYLPHASEKRVPEVVLEAEPSATANFLRWLFEGDGHVSYQVRRRRRIVNGKLYDYDEAQRSVGLATTSKALALQVQQLLLKFGIASRIYENKKDGCFHLYIRDCRSLKRFAEMIGFIDEKKNAKLQSLLRSYIHKEKRNGYAFEKIISIEEVPNPEGFVYDLHVPSTNCFYTNGILSHNTGKTEFLFTILVEALGQNKDISAVFIDTEETFSDVRVSQIAKARGYEPKEILDRTIYIPANDSDFILELIDRLHITIEAKNVKLIFVDSIIAVLRAEFVGRETLWYRQQLLNRILRRLLNLAKVYNVAVVVSNQVVMNPQAQFVYDPIQQKVPTGGTVLGHNANTRLYLRKPAGGGKKRIVHLFDSNWRAEAECTVVITEKGVEDA
jgi:intein/homing endonuclease/RecA/RadA recombinase